MNYVTQNRAPNTGAMLGALAIPAGVGAALAVGLAVTVVVTKPAENPEEYDVTVDLPPPPPKPEAPQPDAKVLETTAPDPVAPKTPLTIPTVPVITTVTVGNLGDDLISLPLPSGSGPIVGPPIAPALPDPIRATPQGDPASWILESDYRSRWIREGLSGTASFTLEIDTRGRVSDCTITRSTGHAVLDGATCRLLSRRARFNPARDAQGDKVAGRYVSSVAWQIP
ncbi:MAG: TonB family protein [Pseudomonadota bacterium]